MSPSRWIREDLVTGAGVCLVLAVVATLTLLGLTTAVSAGRSVELDGATLAVLSVLVNVAMLVGAVAVLWFLARAVERCVDARLARPHSRYVPYLSILVGVATWAMGELVTDDRLVQLVLSTLAALASLVAGELVRRWPLMSLGLCLCVPVVALGTAEVTGRIDTLAWLGDASVRDLALLAFVVVLAVGVPAVVAFFERHWRSPQWMFAERARRRARGRRLRSAAPASRGAPSGVERPWMGTERAPAAAQKAGGAIQRRWHASDQEDQGRR